MFILAISNSGYCIDNWNDYLFVPGQYATIQAAIDAAEEGDVVLVADGTYTGYNNRDIDFYGKAITVMSVNGPEMTVIDCEDNGRGFCFESGESVGSRLEGFTVKNGSDYKGGGIRCYESSPTITNCTITGNTADYGGGIYCTYSSPSITNCAITGNTASGTNKVGGGLYCFSSDPVITNCAITENAAEDGSGIFCSFSDPVITNCTITENTAENGGGIFCSFSAPIITNCILWNDVPDEMSFDYSDPTVTYSDIEGGWSGLGEGNIDIDPLFIDPETGDYSLQIDSPCIDAGDVYSALDPDGSRNDMGVFGGLGKLPEGVLGGEISGLLPVSGSPYIVSENLFVSTEETLSIEPGVELLLLNRSRIDVYGVITAAGIQDSMISFSRFREWDYGGGIRFIRGSGELSYCLIEYCWNADGGGIYCSYSDPAITKCTILENTSDYRGGGIRCYQSSPFIMNCTISRNNADFGYGGAMYCDYSSSAVFTNCMITENTAIYGYSGGIYCLSSDPSFFNCTFMRNLANHGGGIHCWNSSPIIENCILWNDTPDEISIDYSDPTVTYSDIEGGWEGAGNIDEDPLFGLKSWFGFDFGLRTASPCIDTGDPSIQDGIYDADPRCPSWYINRARADMGAYGGPNNAGWLE